jgi:hypothetical protein
VIGERRERASYCIICTRRRRLDDLKQSTTGYTRCVVHECCHHAGPLDPTKCIGDSHTTSFNTFIGHRHDKQQRHECSSRGKISRKVFSLQLAGESLNVSILVCRHRRLVANTHRPFFARCLNSFFSIFTKSSGCPRRKKGCAKPPRLGPFGCLLKP